jgi:hypothetical protein
VEAAVYVCCAEAVRAASGSARIDLLMAEQDLIVRIRGVDRDQVDVQAIVDRIEAVGGSASLGDVDELSISIPTGVAEPAPV